MTQHKKAVFAGGCFWCIQATFDETPGVINTQAGYMGGEVSYPSYEQVCAGDTGHLEVLEITYDPHLTSFEALLNVFWRNIDPFDENGQFTDRGAQYQTAIFYADEVEKLLAEGSKYNIKDLFGKEVKTKILPIATFYTAEEHHQKYYKTHPTHYKMYKNGSGRSARLDTIWQKKQD